MFAGDFVFGLRRVFALFLFVVLILFGCLVAVVGLLGFREFACVCCWVWLIVLILDFY